MTPTQIEDAARQRYNAVSDTFYTAAEIYNLIYAAELQLQRETFIIEASSTQNTVASTQTYTVPSGTMSIKRVTYDGKKLESITMREDDALTLLNAGTTQTGTPQYYFVWNETIYLRPIPGAVKVLKTFYYSVPGTVSASSTLEIPTIAHPALINYVVSEMFAKDQNLQMAQYYRQIWERDVLDFKRWVRKSKKRDAFGNVQDMDSLPGTILGIV